ncbi:antitoxin family protein [Thermococcus thermotolerans]|uniref:antitoxin family protein n=1 Tax=Thermococcus thermotolerans TaxID=2969672 RepID=UPI002156FBF0|nr:antitoxin family protein [Thermococcus thermotolerans]
MSNTKTFIDERDGEIEAIYENGVFKPLKKPPLRDNEWVVLAVKEKVITQEFLRKLEELSKSLPKFKSPSKLIAEDRK